MGLRRNPTVGQHPDLFEGQSAIFVPMDELSEEELKELPRDNYSDEEWEELDEDIQEYIYKHDPESKQRRKQLKRFLEDAVQHIVELDEDMAMSDAEGEIDYYLSDPDQLLENAKHTGDYDSIREEFEGFDEGEFQEHLRESLSDWNNYSFEVDHWSNYHRPSGALFCAQVFTNIYIEFTRPDLSETGIHLDEVRYVVKEELESSDYEDFYEYNIDDIYEAIYSKYGTFDHHMDPVGMVCATLDTEKVIEQLKEDLGEVEVEPAWFEAPPEERVVYRFDDGFFVQRLTPEELPKEGSSMRMCVGRPGMGYADAVRRRSIEILSLRTPAGRPKFTFEIKLDERGKPVDVKQIKGKANRLPGWDLGKEGRGQMKEAEVEKIIEFLDFYGMDPNDVYDMGPAMRELGAGIGHLPSRNPSGRRSFDEPYRP